MIRRLTLFVKFAACGCLLPGASAVAGAEIEFPLLATLDVGQAPHQISFSADGRRAYIAAAGSDWIAEIDTVTFKLQRKIPAPNVPLGVFPLAGGKSLGVSQFAIDALVRIDLEHERELARLDVGGAPSLFSGPIPDDRWLVVSEKANRLSLIDGKRFEVIAHYDTGKRPFPAAVTADGRKAFVPNYDDGTVSVIDLWNARVLAAVEVGSKPSGGVVLPGGNVYAVAVRGEDRVALINTASHEIVGIIAEGIGQQPFSVVTGTGGRWAFVNNTASHDVSVIDLASRQVVARFPVPKIPIVMAVHPSGRSLWVASEGDHLLSIYAIPEMPQQAMTVNEDGSTTEVLVMGMIHNRHRNSQQWGLAEIRQTIFNIKPDIVCAEIPPAHWATAWPEFQATGTVTDERIVRFPEYVDVLLPLQATLGFTIEPCAAWTSEMASFRQARMEAWNSEDPYKSARQAYAQEMAELAAAGGMDYDAVDDPWVIHSAEYDQAVKAELSIYDRYQNEHIGPGGWSNINQAHFDLIQAVIERHPGKRILITFGAGHKYWFLEKLRQRPDVQLLDLRQYLPRSQKHQIKE